MRTTTAEPRRLRADAARNRQSLIDAAQRLFTTRGLSVTLDDIAAEAGLNVATAYRHFANKHELAHAYLEQQIDVAIGIAEQAAAEDDPWSGLQLFLDRMLALIVTHRGLHDVFTVSTQVSQALERLEQRVNPLMDELLKRGKKAGTIRRDVEPGDLGVVLQMLAGVTDINTHDPQALHDRYVHLVLDGLRPAPQRLPGSPPTPADVSGAARTPRR